MDEDFDIPAANEMDADMDLPDDAPMMKVGEEKEIGNQGLKKKLVKEGEGWDTPENGDEVEGISIFFSSFFLISNDFYLAFKVFFSLFCIVLLQFIILERCWMVLSLIPVVIEALLLSSRLVKVILFPFFFLKFLIDV